MNGIQIIAAGRDISGVVTEIEKEDALGTLGVSLRFSVPWGDRISYSDDPPRLGDQVTLYRDGVDVFSGVITADDTTEQSRSYTCHDFCWYLNKSKITVQFSQISVAQAIETTLGEVGISARIIDTMPAAVEETCYCETPSAILSRLMERQSDNDGEEYHIYASRIMEKLLIVERVGSVKPDIYLGEITSPERSETLDGVVNRVEYVTGDSSGYSNTGIFAENTGSVEQYGMIQDIIIAGEEDKDAQTIVNTRIERKSEPIPRVTIECKGDFNLRAGVRIPITVPVVEIAGEYIVESVTNSIRGGTHRMQVTLRAKTNARGYRQTVEESVERNALLILHNKNGKEERFHVRD